MKKKNLEERLVRVHAPGARLKKGGQAVAQGQVSATTRLGHVVTGAIIQDQVRGKKKGTKNVSRFRSVPRENKVERLRSRMSEENPGAPMDREKNLER